MPEVTIPAPTPAPAPAPAPIKPKFVDYETGAFYMEKPEHMTHLVGNVLVVKDHPRILFRGKLDSLQSAVVLAQVDIHERGGRKALLDDLGDIIGRIKSQGAQIYEIDLDRGREERSKNPSAVFSIRLPNRHFHVRVLAAISELESVYAIDEI